MVNLEVNIGGLNLKNPVTTASGTFGFGEEFTDFIDLNSLGGIFVKGLTLKNREGNDYPRMAETASGMLKCCWFAKIKELIISLIQFILVLKDYGTEIIPNINGSVVEEYVEVAEKLNDVAGINALELNISCPNVKRGRHGFWSQLSVRNCCNKCSTRSFPKTNNCKAIT